DGLWPCRTCAPATRAARTRNSAPPGCVVDLQLLVSLELPSVASNRLCFRIELEKLEIGRCKNPHAHDAQPQPYILPEGAGLGITGWGSASPHPDWQAGHPKQSSTTSRTR